jgi:protocatechuate 3,4-dioxygenase, alpha subunit
LTSYCAGGKKHRWKSSMSTPRTPSQTVGPFFHLGMDKLQNDHLAVTGVAGERITVRGRVLDGDGKGVPDAVMELWQADAEGKYFRAESAQGKAPAGGFRGFGRIDTKADGGFSFTTIKPGRVRESGEAEQAPHISVTIFMRGLLKQLFTRVYFPDDPANKTDAVLNAVPAERRATLIVKSVAGDKDVFDWDVILQGEGETVFFDW